MLIVGIVRRAAIPASLAVLVIAGWLVARTDLSRARACTATMVRQHAWRITFQDAATVGALAHGRAHHRGCSEPVSLVLSAGFARAGDIVWVHGKARLLRDRLRIDRATVFRPAGVSLLPAVRRRAGERIDRLFGVNATLARALLIADERSIDPVVRDRFAASGLVHALSISGLHVAVIAAALTMLFRALRLRSGAVTGATVTVVAVYVATIGAPAPAVRAAIMLGVVAASRLWQRPTSPWASLALGAAVPLGDPFVVTTLSYQLSVAGMAGLFASAGLAERWIAPRWDGWRAHMAQAALASAVAVVVTAPLIAWSFGRLSLIAPVANLLATPLIAILQPALFLALILPSALGSGLVADAAQPLLAALTTVASVCAAVPGASISIAPTLIGAWLAGMATIGVIVACVSRFPARAIAVSMLALAIATWMPLAPARTSPERGVGTLELHLIDVGQGDAVAIRTPAGRWILFDAGGAWRGNDAGRRIVIPYLRRRGGPLAALIISHPHADHVGGAATVVSALRPGLFLDGAYVHPSADYRRTLAAVLNGGTRWLRAHPGDTLVVDGVHVRVIAPDSAWGRKLTDPNEASVVAVVEFGELRFLLVGDAERETEEWLLSRDSLALRADVLKVGHHGSVTSTTPRFLAAVRPRVALISVGAANGYGHPNPRVVRALVNAGAEVLRTDQLGTLVLRTDGRALEIEARGERWKAAPRLASSP